MSARVLVGLLFACASAYAPRARAHESAATSPEFPEPGCITVVDRSSDSALQVDYTVPLDDVELEAGDIRVEDAKTHQFFAFRGAMFARGFAFELYDFDEPGAEPILLPEWITIDDVKRAARASGDADGTAFSESDVPPGSTIADLGVLDGRWLRVTPDDGRVPITMEQAQQGVSWDLADVEPGIYTLTGYVFSPPYNAWAPRPGLVVVADGALSRPVGVLDSVDGFLFSYQGRRIQGCLEVPEGTTVDAFFRIEERPEEGWLPWLEEEPVESGELDLCFQVTRRELTGSARIRLDLTAPDGMRTSIYSADTVTALAGDGSCEESETICCDVAAAPGVGAAGEGGSTASADPPDASTGAAGASPLADDAGSGGGEAQDDGSGGDDGGCSAPGGRPTGPSAVLLLLALASLRRRQGARDRASGRRCARFRRPWARRRRLRRHQN